MTGVNEHSSDRTTNTAAQGNSRRCAAGAPDRQPGASQHVGLTPHSLPDRAIEIPRCVRLDVSDQAIATVRLADRQGNPSSRGFRNLGRIRRVSNEVGSGWTSRHGGAYVEQSSGAAAAPDAGPISGRVGGAEPAGGRLPKSSPSYALSTTPSGSTLHVDGGAQSSESQSKVK